ncbi:MAG TPA: hypothetical protein VN879_14580, partial [Candidatus Acidoferrales bacterium]|nr:hypothetical protein [Candidatus Acidoferrales bacterium]
MDTPVRTIASETFVANLAVSNNDTALVGSAPNEAGEAVHIFNLNTGQLLQTLRGQGDGRIVSVALSPNGQLAVASTEGMKAVLWDATTGRLLKSVPGSVGSDTQNQIAFSPDGQLILSSFLG